VVIVILWNVIIIFETRHYYKAESEEELVDWMIAIKKHIPESKIEINDST